MERKRSVRVLKYNADTQSMPPPVSSPELHVVTVVSRRPPVVKRPEINLAEESELDELANGEFATGFLPRSFGLFMLYLGLFIAFLMVAIAVDMESKKHMVFVVGTIIFGLVALWYVALAIMEEQRLNNLLKRIKKRRTDWEAIGSKSESQTQRDRYKIEVL